MSNGICTLLYSHDYLPGVFTLGQRIKNILNHCEGGQDRFRTVLLIPKTFWNEELNEQTKELLNKLYQEIVEIDPFEDQHIIARLNTDNLDLLKRPELLFATIKIKLWNLIQFEKLIYLDCDTLPLKTSFFDDILTETTSQTRFEIGAASDIGWPDMFNSGVLTIIPGMNIYRELVKFVFSNSSVDGADQGILNQFFNPIFNRNDEKQSSYNVIKLPFVFNMTIPNYGYQYSPALHYFKSDIQCVHFIGTNKPWKVEDNDNEYFELWKNTYLEFQLEYIVPSYVDRLAIDEGGTEDDIDFFFDTNVDNEQNNNKFENINEYEPQEPKYPYQFDENVTVSSFVGHICQDRGDQVETENNLPQTSYDQPNTQEQVDIPQEQSTQNNSYFPEQPEFETVPEEPNIENRRTVVYFDNMLISSETSKNVDGTNNGGYSNSHISTHLISMASDKLIYGKELPLEQLAAPLSEKKIMQNIEEKTGTNNLLPIFDWEKTDYLDKVERSFPEDENETEEIEEEFDEITNDENDNPPQGTHQYPMATTNNESYKNNNEEQEELKSKKKSNLINQKIEKKIPFIEPIFDWEKSNSKPVATRTFPEDITSDDNEDKINDMYFF